MEITAVSVAEELQEWDANTKKAAAGFLSFNGQTGNWPRAGFSLKVVQT